MHIEQLTPLEDIFSDIAETIERTRQALIYRCMAIGEMCIKEMRSYNGRAYKDQTGNLRSSTGYAVIVNGSVFNSSSFDVIKRGNEGTKEGKSFLDQVISEYPNGIVLILVAGMNYASAVASKGYNVTDSAELLAEKEVPRLLKELGFK